MIRLCLMSLSIAILLAPDLEANDIVDCDFFRRWAEEGGHDRNMIENNTAVAVGLDTCMYSEKIQCIETADLLLNSYNRAIETFRGINQDHLPLLIGSTKRDGEFNLSIEGNFNALKAIHLHALNDIRTFMTQSLNAIGSPRSLEELQEHNKKINVGLVAAQAMLTEVSREDAKFLHQMQLNATALHQVLGKSAAVLTSNSCDQEVKDKLSIAIKNAEEVVFQLTRLKDYINIAKQKRSILLNKIHQALFLVGQERFAQNLGESLDKVIKDLSIVFALEKVTYDIGNWWLDINRDGLANRLHTMYLQYQSPLRILRAHLGKIAEFEIELNLFNGSAAAARDLLLKDLAGKKSLLLSNIKEIEDTGWSGFLERQVSLLTMFKMNIDAYGDNCRGLVERHEAAAEKTKTLEQFQNVELIFKQIIDTCKKK